MVTQIQGLALVPVENMQDMNTQRVPHGYKNYILYIMVKQEILVFRNHFTKNKGLLWIFF